MLALASHAALAVVRVATLAAHLLSLTPDDCAWLLGTYVHPEDGPAQCVLWGEDIVGADDT